MKHWTILQDVDGCLAKWNESFAELLTKLHGPPPKLGERPPQFICWDWPRDECGYTSKQVNQAWDHVNNDWWLSLDPYDGASEALQRLAELPHDRFSVYFVTGRHPWARSATQAWLKTWGYCTYMPGRYEDPQVICTSNKAELAKVFASESRVVAIEDKPALLLAYSGSPEVELLYAIDQPYNRSVFHGGLTVPSVGAALDDFENRLSSKAAQAA